MYNFNRATIIYLLVFLMIIISLGVLNYFGLELPYLRMVEKGIFNLLSPLLEYCSSVQDRLLSYWKGLMNINRLIAENDRLRQKLAAMNRRYLAAKRFERENRRLRELLSFKRQVPYQTIGARVIGYGPSNWQDKIIINRGQQDGLEKKMPVIGYQGSLVGRVDYVAADYARVTPVYAPEFVVGGIVERSDSREIGVVNGQLNDKQVNIMNKIAWDADIVEGDTILTSGLSNNYPKGLPIGKVIEVESDNYGLSQKASVELFVNRKTIEEVLVITDF